MLLFSSQYASADDGGLVMLTVASAPRADVKTVQAKVVIDAPPGLVWQTITNYPQLKNILPGYEKSDVVKKGPTGKMIDIAMKVAAFLPTYKYRVMVRENPDAHEITLNRISGDFKSLDATYRLIPERNGTRTTLLYQLNLNPGFNLPGSQAIIRSNTEKSLKALERHIEQEARRSVIGQR